MASRSNSKKKRKKTAAPPAGRRADSPGPGAGQPAARRKDSQDAERRRERREKLRHRLTVVGVVVVGLAVVGGYVLFDQRRAADLEAELTAGSCVIDDRSDPTAPAGQNHVTGVSYRVDPPAGGNHDPSPARSGVYAGGSVPTDGRLVHALEHGYVIAWHRPDVGEAELEQLRELQGRNSGDVLVVERPSLPTPVAATAWGRRLLCQQVEPAALARFVEQYVGKGPEDVARG